MMLALWIAMTFLRPLARAMPECRHRSLEGNFVALERIEQLFRNRRAMFLQCLGFRSAGFPFDIDAGTLDYFERRLGNFRADAITGNQCESMFH